MSRSSTPQGRISRAGRLLLGRLRRGGSRQRAALVSGLLELAEGLAAGGEFSERMTLLCRAASSLLQCDRSSVFLLDGDSYRARFNHGNPPEIAAVFHQHRVGLRDPLIAKAMATRHFVVANDALSDSLMNVDTARRAGIRAIVVAPLFRAGDPLGFLTAEYNENPGSFSPMDSTLLLGIAKLGELTIQAEEAAENARKLERELRAAERLEALTRMAGGVAHDLNNCLTVILGAAELLRGESTGHESALEDVQRSAERAAELALRLLHFSGGALAEEGVVNASAALRDLRGALRSSVPADIELDIAVAETDSLAACSPGEFDQITINLVLNAAEASLPGAAIQVRLQEEERGAEAAGGLEPGRYSVLSVRDTGCGVAPEDVPRLFEPFYTTKSTGTGLGLSSVFGIVAKAGGEVEVESKVGVGSEFRVVLPRADREPSPQPEVRRVGGGEAAVPPTILLVDDDEGVRRLAATALRDWGAALVIEADSADQARERAAAHPAEIHLLITDVVMPGAGGRDLGAALAATRPELEILYVSGYSPEVTERRGVVQTVEHFLAKPFTPAMLIAKVSAVLRSAGGTRSAARGDA